MSAPTATTNKEPGRNEYTPKSVREKLSRLPFREIIISGAKAIPCNENGVRICVGDLKDAKPARHDDGGWTFGRNPIVVNMKPDKASAKKPYRIDINPRNHSLFLSQTPNDDLVRLNLGQSLNRKILPLYDGMQLVFNSTFKIKIVSPSMRVFFKKSVWNDALDMDELNSLPSLFSSILSTSNSVQKTSASSLSTDLPAEKYEAPPVMIGKPPLGKLISGNSSLSKSSIRKDSGDDIKERSRKSISWTEDVPTDTAGSIEEEYTNEDRGVFKMVVTKDGKEEVFELNGKGRKVLYVGEPSNVMGTECIRIPGVKKSEAVVAAFVWMSERCCLLMLPITVSSSIPVHLILPNDLCLPLDQDDVVDFGNYSFTLRAPLLLRHIDVKSEKTPRLDSHQFLSEIAIEVNSQDGKDRYSSLRTVPETLPPTVSKIFGFSGEWFNQMHPHVIIGKSPEGCQVVIENDQKISKQHLVIEKISSPIGTHLTHFTLRNFSTKRQAYLLVGRGETYNRGALALRSGDSFFVGRSEFKVLYQQRGSRSLPKSTSVLEELEERVNVSQRAGEFYKLGSVANLQELKSPDGLNIHKLGSSLMSFDSVDEIVPLRGSKDGLNQSSASSSRESRKDGDMVKITDWDGFCNSLGVGVIDDGPQLLLVSTKGPKSKRLFLCNPIETLIGSSQNAGIRIESDLRMHPIHARVYFDARTERWMLSDCQSTHGTFLKLSFQNISTLTPGDVFVVGQSLIRVFGQPINQREEESEMEISPNNSARSLTQKFFGGSEKTLKMGGSGKESFADSFKKKVNRSSVDLSSEGRQGGKTPTGEKKNRESNRCPVS